MSGRAGGHQLAVKTEGNPSCPVQCGSRDCLEGQGCESLLPVQQPQRGTSLKLPVLCLAGRHINTSSTLRMPGRLVSCSAFTALLTGCTPEPHLHLASRHSRQNTGLTLSCNPLDPYQSCVACLAVPAHSPAPGQQARQDEPPAPQAAPPHRSRPQGRAGRSSRLPAAAWGCLRTPPCTPCR